MSTRMESDSFGDIAVPSEHHWGAQTQRSLEHFKIGERRMPDTLLAALVLVKKTAAGVNRDLGLLAPELANAIVAAADEVLAGEWPGEFPLKIWQTGSGTQTNMNVNEVLASIANEGLTGKRGGKSPVHPNDHVNLCQSSNDAFPTAMHLACAGALHLSLLPAVGALGAALDAKAVQFADIVKVGRTHAQDATPITLGQEFSGYAAQVSLGRDRVLAASKSLLALAQGATAVGTGLNAHPEFSKRFCAAMAATTGMPFAPAGNLFEAIASHDAIASVHGELAALAGGLFKIANDIRLLGSGPRSGLGELLLPENEPGSSIMPGKVNPTQCEALTMVCCRVFGNQTTINMACSQGQFELNAYKPVIADAALESIGLIADACESFREYCVAGLRADAARAAELVEKSLMLATALTPKIGYDKAAKIAKSAHASGASLRQAAIDSGDVSAEDYDALVQPKKMTAPFE